MRTLLRRKITNIPTYRRWNIVFKAAVHKHSIGVKIGSYIQQISHRICSQEINNSNHNSNIFVGSVIYAIMKHISD